jgi:hypothetical protein
MSAQSGAKVVSVSSLLHASARQPLLDETWFRVVKPGPCRSLDQMSDDEIAALEAQYGCPVVRR